MSRNLNLPNPIAFAERDSALSYSVVVIFIILTIGLLAGAATKDSIGKRLQHTSLHAWYDVRVAGLRAWYRIALNS